MCCTLQVPTFDTTLRGRVLLDLFSEPDIFNIKWDALTQYNGIIYPAPARPLRAHHECKQPTSTRRDTLHSYSSHFVTFASMLSGLAYLQQT